ncbi:hypothetical protein ACOSP7_024087 [Xanthoceras sorbifolium]
MKFSSVLWWNEQRLWMIKSITAYIYGILDAILKYFGMRHPSFLPADNAANEIIPNRRVGETCSCCFIMIPLLTLPISSSLVTISQ